MYVCMHACMYVWMDGWMYIRSYSHEHVTVIPLLQKRSSLRMLPVQTSSFLPPTFFFFYSVYTQYFMQFLSLFYHKYERKEEQ